MNDFDPSITATTKHTSEKDDGLHNYKQFRILFALDNLQFRPLNISDPLPTGRQLLAAAGLQQYENFSLFAILDSGDFEDIRLDETFDLRNKGVERFIAFQTDRTFKLTLDQRQLVWGKQKILGSDLYFLAENDDETAIFLEVRGGQDQLINLDDVIDLAKPGVERFITAPKPDVGFVITLNSREYVLNEAIATYAQIVALEFQYPPANPNIIYTMTFRHAASKPHAGEMVLGASVTVKKKGTIFNVTPTDKS